MCVTSRYNLGFGLAENQNLIFCFGLGYAKIGCLAETSAETVIKDNFSAKIKYSAELFGSFGPLPLPQGCAGHYNTVLDDESLSSTFHMTQT